MAENSKKYDKSVTLAIGSIEWMKGEYTRATRFLLKYAEDNEK